MDNFDNRKIIITLEYYKIKKSFRSNDGTFVIYQKHDASSHFCYHVINLEKIFFSQFVENSLSKNSLPILLAEINGNWISCFATGCVKEHFKFNNPIWSCFILVFWGINYLGGDFSRL